MTAEKKKMGKLRRIFNYAGAAFLTVHFGLPQIIGQTENKTEDVSDRLGVPMETMSRVSQGRFTILYPESKSSLVYVYATANHHLIHETRSQHLAAQKGGAYSFYGFSYKNTMFGQKGMLDMLTFGQSGKLASCAVFFPSEKLTFETLKNELAPGLESRTPHFPGRKEDYLKLILFHELEHCNQSFRMKADQKETLADRHSFDAYLAEGGNKEVVRSILYMRTLAAISTLMSEGPEKENLSPYGKIPYLYARYFGGPVIQDKDHVLVSREVHSRLKEKAQREGMETFYAHRDILRAAKAVLNDPAPLSPQARALLTQYKNACEFFENPGESPKTAQKTISPALQAL